MLLLLGVGPPAGARCELAAAGGRGVLLLLARLDAGAVGLVGRVGVPEAVGRQREVVVLTAGRQRAGRLGEELRHRRAAVVRLTPRGLHQVLVLGVPLGHVAVSSVVLGPRAHRPVPASVEHLDGWGTPDARSTPRAPGQWERTARAP